MNPHHPRIKEKTCKSATLCDKEVVIFFKKNQPKSDHPHFHNIKQRWRNLKKKVHKGVGFYRLTAQYPKNSQQCVKYIHDKNYNVDIFCFHSAFSSCFLQ